ncbi:hypothetical protein BGZ54_010548 [Gamsiella multidivaricata]|nr:hypothetical protein BGZ54_010548 [Gamsiella multidivaricata]
MLRRNALLSDRTAKYVSLAIGIIVMALSGSLFSFASLGTDLKARFGFTSSNINLLAAIGDTAMYVGFLIVGPIYDHYGERWTLIAASVLTFLGYGGIYLAALAANMANFSAATSGTVSGVLLAFFGLSATLFSQVKTHLFSGENEPPTATGELKGSRATQNYLLFLTIITTVIYVIAAIFMVKVNKPAVKTLDSGSSSNTTINHDLSEKQATVSVDTASPAQALSRNTTFTPSMFNGREPGLRLEDWNQSSATLDKQPATPESAHHIPGDHILEDTAPPAPAAAPVTTTDPTKATFNPYLTSVDMKPKQLLFESTFWFFVIAQVSQQGFSYINNVDSIIHAILDPMDPSTVTRSVSLTGLHVTLISIGNCLGRLASGIVSDWVIARYRISRSIFFFVSEALILIPLLIMGFSKPVVSLAGLIISSCLIGATYGATGALFASMTRDFFGNKYYGSACGMVMVLNGANPFIANQLYGLFYDRAVKNMPPAPVGSVLEDHMTCVGSSCYDSSFKIASLLQLVCILSAGLLFWAHMKKGKKLMQKMMTTETV